jgi:hypothetical protein
VGSRALSECAALTRRLRSGFALIGRREITSRTCDGFERASERFNFDGFLRQGVGDPSQLELAVTVTFQAPTVGIAGRARSSR